MTNFSLIAAAAISLLAVAPAVAKQHNVHHRYIRSHQHAVSYGSAYNAYGSYRRDEFAPGNAYGNDFNRRNTFN